MLDLKYIRILFLLFFLCFLNFNGFSHSGYHKNKAEFWRKWNLKNGKYFFGNFYFGDKKYIFLLGPNGEKHKIPLNELSRNDVKVAQIKIHRIERLNQEQSFQIPLNQHYDNYLHQWKIFSFYHLVILLILAILYLVDKKKYFWLAIGLFACKTESLGPNISSPKTYTTQINDVNQLEQAFAPFKNTISTRSDAQYFYVESQGIPLHNMMVGINAWQQQVPIPQPYTGSNAWSIPLKCEIADNPLPLKSNLMKGAIAIAVNGVPIFNALNNRGEDSFLIGELDQWGGHCGRADDYHYHIAPLHLKIGSNPIAFGLDGYPMYADIEPDGSQMKVLDALHGHIGYDGNYHYHGTLDFPYTISSMRGKVNLDPKTSAPENQIIPQAFANPIRPALTLLKGAQIVKFDKISTSHYIITYKLDNKVGTVDYQWSGVSFKFIFTNTNGEVITENYVRK